MYMNIFLSIILALSYLQWKKVSAFSPVNKDHMLLKIEGTNFYGGMINLQNSYSYPNPKL